jgi:cytidylate kinase
MRNWELARSQQPANPIPKVEGVYDFVTFSRRAGCGGSDVAALLGQRLGWPVFDRELLHAMAGDDAIRRRLYESMDERDLNWLEEVLRSFMSSEFPRNDYFHRLTSTVLAVARKDHAIFLGRATDLILPRASGLRVRVTAPIEYCAQRWATRRRIPLEHARAEIQRTEVERAQFVENHFDTEARDESRYDLTINAQGFTIEEAVEVILSALRLRRMAP